MWYCLPPGPCSDIHKIDGIIGLGYTICGSYSTLNQYDTATCAPSNYGRMCTEGCNVCSGSCTDAATCDDACTNTVTRLGQVIGGMKPLTAQLGIDVFGMHLCPGSTGSAFVVRNPLQKHALYTGAVQYTDVVNYGWYMVEFVDIRLSGLPHLVVNGKNVSTFLSDAPWRINVGSDEYDLFPTIFDTGTSGIGIWNLHIVDALTDALSTAGFIIPFDCEPESALGRPLNEWPDIELVFMGGASMSVPATAYLNNQKRTGAPLQPISYEWCPPNLYSWGIAKLPANNGCILGNAVMWPYYIIFDHVGGRVGWAPKGEACPNT